MQHKQRFNSALLTWLLALILWGCRGLPFQVGDGEGGAGGEAPSSESCKPEDGAYPGPGITLGPALVFGYRAAKHALATGAA